MSNYIPLTGSQNNPVILASGILGIFDTSYTNMHYNKYISELKITERLGGRMKMQLLGKDSKKVYITGCVVSQAESQKIPRNTVSAFGRNVGAHWFSVYLSGDDDILIHETHVEDEDNDTWDSTVLDREDILSISIIVFGYVTD